MGWGRFRGKPRQKNTLSFILYLPTYIAEQRKIFQTVDRELEVEFYTPGGQESSDVLAMQTMVEESHKNEEIAGAFPVVRRRLPLFSQYFSEVWQALRESEGSNEKS